MDGCCREVRGAHARAPSLQSQAQRLAVDTCLSGDSNDRHPDQRRKRTNGRDPQSLHIKNDSWLSGCCLAES